MALSLAPAAVHHAMSKIDEIVLAIANATPKSTKDGMLLADLITALRDLTSAEFWEKGAVDHWTEDAPTIVQVIRKRLGDSSG